MGSGCSTAVDHMPQNQKIVGSNAQECLAFNSSLSNVPRGGTALKISRIKIAAKLCSLRQKSLVSNELAKKLSLFGNLKFVPLSSTRAQVKIKRQHICVRLRWGIFSDKNEIMVSVKNDLWEKRRGATDIKSYHLKRFFGTDDWLLVN